MLFEIRLWSANKVNKGPSHSYSEQQVIKNAPGKSIKLKDKEAVAGLGIFVVVILRMVDLYNLHLAGVGIQHLREAQFVSLECNIKNQQ